MPPSIHSAETQKNASLNGLDYLHILEMNTNSLATKIKSYESVNSSALVE